VEERWKRGEEREVAARKKKIKEEREWGRTWAGLGWAASWADNRLLALVCL
jgi:hypothetical protein